MTAVLEQKGYFLQIIAIFFSQNSPWFTAKVTWHPLMVSTD